MDKKQELIFTEETLKEIGDNIIQTILDDLPDFIDSGVRDGLLPQQLIRDITEFITANEDARFDRLEINLIIARGQLHKRVREYVYKQLPTAIRQHGEEHYNIEKETDENF